MSSKQVPQAPRPTPNAPPWVKALVALHVVAITVWCLPNPPDSVQNGSRPPAGTDHLLVFGQERLKELSPIRVYVLSTGMWQYWDMFAPNPTQMDLYGSAEIVYRDGTVRPYRYPRVHDYPIARKYLKERYRKFFERVRPDDNSWLWPTFADRIALLSARDPANPPVRVRLRRHWLPVAPPGFTQQKEYSSFMFYEQAVDPEDLARNAGWR
ncbi:MAG TPA: hypothetical protein VGE01_13725 [Fimbriimonas sp.]